MTGSIIWFSAKKGYGFLRPDGKLSDLFVHYSQIRATGFRTLSEGDEVAFEIGEGPTGRPEAKDVVVIS